MGDARVTSFGPNSDPGSRWLRRALLLGTLGVAAQGFAADPVVVDLKALEAAPARGAVDNPALPNSDSRLRKEKLHRLHRQS